MLHWSRSDMLVRPIVTMLTVMGDPSAVAAAVALLHGAVRTPMARRPYAGARD
jgi:hypothetical protein